MPGERTSVYLAADLATAVKARGTPLALRVSLGLSPEISWANDL